MDYAVATNDGTTSFTVMVIVVVVLPPVLVAVTVNVELG